MSDMPLSPLPFEQTFDGTIGHEVLEVGADRARSRTAVSERVKQPFGLVHGGVYAAMAESLASMATYGAVYEEGNMAVGLSNHTSFMRPILSGFINADAKVRHRGSTTWVWEVEITDDDGRLCALSRVTMAVRPAR